MKDRIKKAWENIIQKIRHYDCTICDEWKVFDNFYDWYISQVGYDCGYEVDKDLLVKGNKHYSPTTCVLLPSLIDSALTKTNRAKGCLPIGVTMVKDKYVAKCRYTEDGAMKRKTIGYYDNEEDAFNAYKAFKKDYLKKLAESHIGKIDARAIEALLNYEINITD